MICKSFNEFPRGELLLARDNLADVFVYELAQENSLEHLWHIAGNLVLAESATTDSGLSGQQIESGLMPVLRRAGADVYDSARLARQITDSKVLRLIFPLGHIPDDAPELLLGSRSRELDIHRFAAEARKLHPQRRPDKSIQGNGNNVFIGAYLRKLG